MRLRRPSLRVLLSTLAFAALSAGCGSDEVSSDEQARRAYLGLDASVEKALQLGFAGFNAASNANIPAQSAPGASAGQLTITGQVDQGSSANKGMRLRVGMTGYSDGEIAVQNEDPVVITYDTAADPAAQPALELSLRNIPNGTFTGTLVGDFTMAGDLEDTVKLDLTFEGEIEDDGTGAVRRKAGSTHVMGTATSGRGGTYEVHVNL